MLLHHIDFQCIALKIDSFNINKPFARSGHIVQKSHVLVSKLRSGTSKTMQLVPVHLDLLLFWNLVPCDQIVQRDHC